jgi:predicted ribosome quality control (RQC) complex YloA/Tae2 family protein
MQPELDRGYVQRVRVAQLGGRKVALFEVRIPGETVHLVCAAGLGVGVLDRERRDRLRDAMRAVTSAGDATNALWRARFEGASVVRVGLQALELAREGRRMAADCAERGNEGALHIVEFPLELSLDLSPERELSDSDAPARAALEQRGVVIADALATLETTGRREALRRALRKAIAKIERRAAAVEGDLARIEGADALGARALLFVAAAATAPRGSDRLHAVDWTSGEAQAVELPIDPARGPREQIEALFKRARRLKDGGRVARARLADARASRASLERVLSDLATPGADLAELEVRGRAAAPRDFKLAHDASPGVRRPARPFEQARRPPYRTFAGASGARILVGRGAAQNDALTFRVARPHDLWLHARDVTGAHVVVGLAKGEACPPDWLAEAAHLAAHFSDARDERLVDVIYTPRRYLRKPRGSAPGLVIVDREKVFVLRKDDRVLQTLLEGEVV